MTHTSQNNTTSLEAHNQKSDILPKDWAADINFDADEVLAAYFMGREDGKKEDFDKWVKEFSLNVKLATSIAEELYSLGKEKELNLHSIHLKAHNLSSFEALFLVNEDSIKSDSFLEAYVISRYLRNKYKTDKFNLSFSFTADSQEIDISCLATDGFFIKYEKRKAD